MPTPYAPLPDDWSRALAVVAHPDDLEWGAAGAVARWTTEGRTVSYLLVTRGEAGIDTIPPAKCGPLREAEEWTAARTVGVDVVEFLDHADGTLDGAYHLPDGSAARRPTRSCAALPRRRAPSYRAPRSPRRSS